MTSKGYTCFGFDYRGTGKSQGAPGRVLLEERVADIAAAAAFVRARPQGLAPLVLVGSGAAGGLVIEAASTVPNVAALASLDGFYDGNRFQKSVRNEADYKRFVTWVADQSRRQRRTGDSPLVDLFRIYPVDPDTREYVKEHLIKSKGFSPKVRAQLAESLMRFSPGKKLSHLKKTPILIAHGRDNNLHPASEAELMHARYPGPKELFWIDEDRHCETIDPPVISRISDEVDAWLKRLAAQPIRR